MPLTRESPPFRGKLNKFPVQIARAAVERRDFCFHNNRSSLRATFSDVIPRDEGTCYTHGREAVNRTGRHGSSLSFAFSPGRVPFLGVQVRRVAARVCYACT